MAVLLNAENLIVNGPILGPHFLHTPHCLLVYCPRASCSLLNPEQEDEAGIEVFHSYLGIFPLNFLKQVGEDIAVL